MVLLGQLKKVTSRITSQEASNSLSKRIFLQLFRNLSKQSSGINDAVKLNHTNRLGDHGHISPNSKLSTHLPAKLAVTISSKEHCTNKDSSLIFISRELDEFELKASGIDDKSLVHAFLLKNVQYRLKLRNLSFQTSGLSVDQIIEIIELIHLKKISIESAEDILDMLLNGDQRSAKEIVECYNWYYIYEGTAFEDLCLKVLITHKKQAKKYKRTGKRYHLFPLLTALSEITSRASLTHAEEVLKKLVRNLNNK